MQIKSQDKTTTNSAEKPDFHPRHTTIFEKPLSLDEYIIKRPAATFLMRVKGEGLTDIGIFSEDFFVIDRSINPVAKHVIVGILEDEMIGRKLFNRKSRCFWQEEKFYLPKTYIRT